MVYKHRMKNGKVRHYSNKQAYLNSVKGMFANLNSDSSIRKKTIKAKSKSKRRMQHRGGVGKISSVKKKTCEKCKREKTLNKGICKECEKAFKEYKQPDFNIKNIPKRQRYQTIGDRITDNWHRYIDNNWESIHNRIINLPPHGDGVIPVMFISISFDNQEVEIEDIRIDPDNWRRPPEKADNHWFTTLYVGEHTTNQDLKDFDLAEHSGYWQSLWVYNLVEDI